MFGLSENRLFYKPDDKSGAYLLERIMEDGNFGHLNERNRMAHNKGSMALYVSNLRRLSGMLRYYPSEVLWAPFWKMGHFIWRKVKGY